MGRVPTRVTVATSSLTAMFSGVARIRAPIRSMLGVTWSGCG
jgi:hypothetical protein